MTIEEQVRGLSCLKEVGFGVLGALRIAEYFIETSKRLLKDSNLKAH